jgi:hypothetical protein
LELSKGNLIFPKRINLSSMCPPCLRPDIKVQGYTLKTEDFGGHGARSRLYSPRYREGVDQKFFSQSLRFHFCQTLIDTAPQKTDDL